MLMVHVNMIAPKRIHPRILSTTLALKYIFKFSNFVMGTILSQYTPYIPILQYFLDFLK
jgi:hypothetical protein